MSIANDVYAFKDKFIYHVARFVAIVFLLLCAANVFSQTPDRERCTIPHLKGGKYKLSAELEGNPLMLDIVIKPFEFNKEFLTVLAERLRSNYCHEKILMVSIFENKSDTEGWFSEFVISRGKTDRRRGTYVLDRKNGSERFEYNLKKGNPMNECILDLESEKAKVVTNKQCK